MNKTCFKCGEEKPVDDFYRHPAMADGRLGKCKSCTRRDVIVNRESKIDEYRKRDRMRYYRDGAEKRGSSNWSKRNPELASKCKSGWRERNTDKRRAEQAVCNAIRDGRIVKRPCEKCGSTHRIHGHHEDYSRLLDVVWLCPKHHGERHREINETKRL